MESQFASGRLYDGEQIRNLLRRDTDLVPKSARKTARERGVSVHRIKEMPGLTEFGAGSHRHRMLGVLPDTSSTVGMRLTCNKATTKFVLQRTGLPVPRGPLVSTLESAISVANQIGYPVVIKPPDSSFSRGVFNDIFCDEDLARRFPDALRVSPSRTLLIEELIRGRKYRASVVDGKFTEGYESRYGGVIGDGVHTIQELIDEENTDPRRVGPPESHYYPIIIDEVSESLLAEAGFGLDHVLDNEQRFDLQRFPTLKTGATLLDVTNTIHPDNCRIFEQATAAVGLTEAAIDFVTPDESRPINENGGAILEINCESAFTGEYYLFDGPIYDTGRMFIDMFFPEPEGSTAPVITVAQAPLSTDICHQIAREMEAIGSKAGVSDQNGITIDGMHFAGLETSGLAGFPILLHNPHVDVAIVEVDCSRSNINASSLPYCDTAVIPSLSGAKDNDGNPVELQLADLAHTNGGQILLNQDDSSVSAIAKRYGGNVAWFSALDPSIPAWTS